jgi:glycosyltransferase involved in cell wall biosynthesis
VRILLVTPFLPHRDAGHGTATVASRFVEYFASRHSLQVLTFCHGPRDRDLLRDLQGRGARVRALPFPGRSFWRRQQKRLSSFFGARPFMAALFDAGSMRRELAKLLREETFDLVQFDTTQMGSYVDLLDDWAGTRVLLEIDVSMKPLRRRYQLEGNVPRRLLRWLSWKRMLHYEPALCRRFDRVYAVSQEDCDLLASAGVPLPALFRYGVDPDLFEVPRGGRAGTELLFFGSFMHPPNVDAARWFTRSILPRVRAQVPEARLTIAGGAEAAVSDLAREPGVTLRGFVPDVKSCLAAADVGVVPLRWGGGVKLKTLEMMASGLPIVSTPVGAEGIRAGDGEHLLLAVTEDEFASRTVALLRDAERGRRIGASARQLMSREHRWSENLAELERDYQRLVRGTAPDVQREAPSRSPGVLLAGIEPTPSTRES